VRCDRISPLSNVTPKPDVFSPPQLYHPLNFITPTSASPYHIFLQQSLLLLLFNLVLTLFNRILILLAIRPYSPLQPYSFSHKTPPNSSCSFSPSYTTPPPPLPLLLLSPSYTRWFWWSRYSKGSQQSGCKGSCVGLRQAIPQR
jgi:hypothetical protein